MIVRIKRQESENSESYWQSFEYHGDLNESVARVLDALNFIDDLVDTEGKEARRIQWECSCLQKMCGACAMVINGVPALACNTFLNELKSKELVLEPLSKFPVVCDLVVDRSIMQEHLRMTEAYAGDAGPISKKDYEHRYLTGKCIKCGLCLEVCPNYKNGLKFFGAVYANDMFHLHSESGERKKEVKRVYKKNFESKCSHCFTCQKVCPMEIPTASSMAKMNRFF